MLFLERTTGALGHDIGQCGLMKSLAISGSPSAKSRPILLRQLPRPRAPQLGIRQSRHRQPGYLFAPFRNCAHF
jgi:hypothetical protein